MYNLGALSISDMARVSSALRHMGEGADSMEAAASSLVRHLYDHLVGDDGQRACALVRLYKTHAYDLLEPELQEFARNALGSEPSEEMICLTLLATVGDQPEWSDRRRSAGHRAIPLPSEDAVKQFPMISQLVQQLGLEVRTVVRPDPLLLVDLGERTFNVFHVPEAHGSPFIPAQEGFVVPFQIRSVLGFGGVMPTGDLFALILFSRNPIPEKTAQLFKPLALSAKLALLPFVDGPVFASEASPQ